MSEIVDRALRAWLTKAQSQPGSEMVVLFDELSLWQRDQLRECMAAALDAVAPAQAAECLCGAKGRPDDVCLVSGRKDAACTFPKGPTS